MQTEEKNQRQQNSQGSDPAKASEKTTAAKQAEEDISKDPDLQPDTSKTADLDEGELARVDNSND